STREYSSKICRNPVHFRNEHTKVQKSSFSKQLNHSKSLLLRQIEKISRERHKRIQPAPLSLLQVSAWQRGHPWCRSQRSVSEFRKELWVRYFYVSAQGPSLTCQLRVSLRLG